MFIAYHDLSWAPETERLRNEKRFTLLFAPITRTYTQSYAVEADADAIQPNVRNHLVPPHGMRASLAYLEAWQKVFPATALSTNTISGPPFAGIRG